MDGDAAVRIVPASGTPTAQAGQEHLLKRVLCLLAVLIVGLWLFHPVARAEVEGTTAGALAIEGVPVDVAVSADGQWTFVLTESGSVLVYSAAGAFQGAIQLSGPARQIAASPRGDRLFVTRPDRKEIEVVSVDFVYPIDVTGSPIKGPGDARVTVAVYSDFQ